VELLSGLIGLAVGFLLKLFGDLLMEGRRRKSEELARLHEAKLRHAIDVLEAAARLTKGRQDTSTATRKLANAKDSGDEAAYQQHLPGVTETREAEASAFTDAEKGYNAISLLMPAAADATRLYLNLCNQADAHPDAKRDAREKARCAAEDAIRKAVGAKSKQQKYRGKGSEIKHAADQGNLR